MPQTFLEIFSSFTSVMHLLRDKKFQWLLENYERAKKTFMVGYDVVDEVSSNILFVAGEKNDLKPEDYLFEFSEFVIRKSIEIEALSIILNRPQEWNTKTLNELRELLKKNDFSEVQLQKAHKLVYQKSLIDIISMVKHAVKKEEPLLDTNERVDRAVKKVMQDKELSYEQLEWMKYIKEHLMKNLTIEKDDFEMVPVFEQRGGWSKYKRIFGDIHNELLQELNTNIAA